MAYVTECSCHKCHKSWRGVKPAHNLCGECSRKIADEKRRRHFQGLDGLTTEERLRRLEEWVYNYKAPVNINDIKFG